MRRAALVLALAAVAGLAATALAAPSHRIDPRKAAAVLVRNLRPNYRRCGRCGSFGATQVVHRHGALGFGVGSDDDRGRERFRIYRWNDSRWQLVADVKWRGWGSAQWPRAASLTGSPDPDFASEGCGAADTNCLSVVSDIRGRWHVVPFEYGYGRAVVVNGLPAGHLVQTEVDACSCAGGPSTWLYERYTAGVFRPTRPPGRNPRCTPWSLAEVAGEGSVNLLQFDRIACRAGWAIGVGTGAGYTGRVVGLFTRSYAGGKWRLLNLDNGTALPAAPAIYDLPRGLLVSLARHLGPQLRPMISAAGLIARLQQQHGFYWPQQNGLVAARGALWLVAPVPVRRPRDPSNQYAVGASVYRWTGRHWAISGRIRRLPGGLNLGYLGGWLVSVPARSPSVSFARVWSDALMKHSQESKSVITNAGGRWHVALR